MNRLIAFIALLAISSLLPGCIVGEIRDELQTANKQLNDVQTTLEKLDKTNEQLTTTNEELARTAGLIGEVEQGLNRIDTTNTSLGSVDQRLALLQSINTSLGRLDTHLASLRKTIGRIDSAIPFFDLGSDEAGTEPPPADEAAAEPAADTAPVVQAAPGPTGQPTPANPAGQPATPEATDAPSTTPAPTATTPHAREPLLGAWISRYPDSQTALILLADGRFILSKPTVDPAVPAGQQQPVIAEHAGTWKRQGHNIVLEGDSRPMTTPDGKSVDASDRYTIEIVMVAGRAATIRLNGQLLVLARP